MQNVKIQSPLIKKRQKQSQPIIEDFRGLNKNIIDQNLKFQSYMFKGYFNGYSIRYLMIVILDGVD